MYKKHIITNKIYYFILFTWLSNCQMIPNDKAVDESVSVNIAVTEIIPNEIPSSGGLRVTLFGENFPTDVQVKIGEKLVKDLEYLNKSRITFTSPPLEAGLQDMTVSGFNSTLSAIDAFKVYISNIQFRKTNPLIKNIAPFTFGDKWSGDFNGDGLDDIILRDDNLIAYYLNQNRGTNFEKVNEFQIGQPESDISEDGNEILFVGDVDNDGLCDFATDKKIFISNGIDSFDPIIEYKNYGYDDIAKMGITGDIDGDYDYEIILFFDSFFILAEIDSLRNFNVIQEVQIDQESLDPPENGILMWDFSGDGVLDLLYYRKSLEEKDLVEIRTGPDLSQDPIFSYEHTNEIKGIDIFDGDRFDWDADKSFDIIIGSYDGAILIGGNGNGSFVEPIPWHEPCTEDISLYPINPQNSMHPHIRFQMGIDSYLPDWWYFRAIKCDDTYYAYCLESDGTMHQVEMMGSPLFINLDGDGWHDLVFRYFDHLLAWVDHGQYNFLGDLALPVFSEIKGDHYLETNLSLNADETSEILASYRKDLIQFEWNGSRFIKTQILQFGETIQESIIEDLDNDGQNDLIVQTIIPTTNHYGAYGINPFFGQEDSYEAGEIEEVHLDNIKFINEIFVGDRNGDNDKDILITFYKHPPIWLDLENRVFTPKEIIFDLDPYSVFYSEDLDLDGDMDLYQLCFLLCDNKFLFNNGKGDFEPQYITINSDLIIVSSKLLPNSNGSYEIWATFLSNAQYYIGHGILSIDNKHSSTNVDETLKHYNIDLTHSVQLSSSTSFNIHLGDFNGDLRTDALLANNSPPKILVVYEEPTTHDLIVEEIPIQTTPSTKETSTDRIQTILITDYDQNGLTDFLYTMDNLPGQIQVRTNISY